MSAFELIPVVLAGAKMASTMKGQMDQVATSNAATQAQAQTQAQQLALSQQIDERRRQQALKQGLASQRAAFGAAGLSGADGSGQALLAGLSREAASQDAEADQLYDLRRASLRTQSQTTLNRNLLDQADGNRRALFSWMG